jgi:DNA topoisomerase-3
LSTIFITEKPSVAQEYKKVLKVQQDGRTNGYIEGYSSVMNTNVIITWAVGHLISICSPEEHNEDWKSWKKEYLPMIPNPFEYKPQSNTYDQFKVVKSVYTRNDIDCIYYAGDSGREGIYIQALIRNQIFKSAPRFTEKVVWIDSFTEQAILNGIKNTKPYSEYLPMIDSGYARAIDDWLIGMNLSRAFTITSGGYGNAIAVGRVMTPTLAMVVNRQNEIDNFVKTSYYGVKADDFASWKAVEGSRFFESDELYNENGFLKKEKAEALCQELDKDSTLTVDNVKVQTKTEYAPYLFNLADLQAYCSRAFKISPAKTLEIAQSLYEKKLTTYPRTDCRFLSTAVQSDLKAKHGYNIPNRYVDDDKIVDHYAIIPTFEGGEADVSGLERDVYLVIRKRIMDTMKPPFIYDAVSVQYIHSNKEKFFESFRIIKQAGFKDISDEEQEDVKDKPVPVKGQTVMVSSFHTYDMETRPPSAYTTGSLILAMEKAGKLIEDEELREQIKTCGIGTSATRASIIEKLIDTNLITTDKKQKVAPTERGKQIVAIVAKYDEALVSPLKTAEMEQQLQSIAEKNLTREQHSQSVNKYLCDTVANIFAHNTDHIAGAGNGSAVTGKCPKCGGEVAKGKFGWYCKSKCGMNLSKVFGHDLTDNQISKLLEGKEITYTANGKKTAVLPEVVQNDWQGKTYFNWKTKSGGSAKSTGSSPKKSSSKSSSEKSSRTGWGGASTTAKSSGFSGGTWGRK